MLRAWLFRRLALTAMLTFFQGHASHEACIVHHLGWLSRLTISKIQIFRVYMLYDLVYGAMFSLTAMSDYFQGQMSPEALLLPILTMIMLYSSSSFLVNENSDLKHVKLSHGRMLRPCLCSQFSLMAMPTHFQCQTSPNRA